MQISSAGFQSAVASTMDNTEKFGFQPDSLGAGSWGHGCWILDTEGWGGGCGVLVSGYCGLGVGVGGWVFRAEG